MSESLSVLDEFGSPDTPVQVDGEYLYPADHEVALHLERPLVSQAPSFLVLKPSFRSWTKRLHHVAANFFLCDLPLNHAFVAALEHQVGRSKCPLQVVGDLDPLALCTYLALRSGTSWGLPPMSSVAWHGVGDSWLSVVSDWLSRPLMSVTIQLSSEECRLLSMLERELDLETTVGPLSARLLRSGRKLELEGASNPALFEDGFVDDFPSLFESESAPRDSTTADRLISEIEAAQSRRD